MRRLLPSPADAPDLGEAYALPTGVGRYLRMNFVASADGAISLNGRSAGLSTPGDKVVFGTLRDLADVILVGAGTVRDEQYGPPPYGPERRAARRARGLAEVPPYAVVSGSLDLDPTSSLFTEAQARTIVITHAAAPADRRTALARTGEVIIAGEQSVDLAGALARLAKRGLCRVLCEGGPALFGTLLAADLVDELCLTLSPLLAGPGAGRVIGGRAPLVSPRRLELALLLEEDGALFLRYLVDRAGRPAPAAAAGEGG